MRLDFKSYIDSFDSITIIINKKFCDSEKKFFLQRSKYLEELSIIRIDDIGESYKYICLFSEEVKLHLVYHLFDESNNHSILFSGRVVRDPLFDQKFKYDGKLGIVYTKSQTTFKLWTPVAKDIILELISPNNEKSEENLKYLDSGLWEITLKGDYEGYKYRYNVRVNATYSVCLDPYGIASNSNAQYNYVIDLSKIYQMKNRNPKFSGNYVDAIIYELNIRDFTIDKKINILNKGKYKGIIEDSKYSLNYVKSLGVTHIQLMPVYDFGGVDELSPNLKYNWGYNPEQYFVPEGWFSEDSENPYTRISELKEVIDKAHNLGLRVNMDVVFNHVFDYQTFPFEKLIPGYFYRVNEHSNYTEVSGCQNDLATEKYMCSRFIKDVCEYWVEEFKINGFRFDLMGLLDINTLNYLKTRLKSIDETIMLYGEGWNMANTIAYENRPINENNHKLPGYGFFNDSYRDFFKGSQWNNSLGFCLGSSIKPYDLFNLFFGSCIFFYKFRNPNQTINYVECHDNYTFFDYAKKNSNMSVDNIKECSKLALSIVILSQGVPFIHAGQEFFRTKNMVENSYNSGDEINKMDWNRMEENLSNVNTLKDLIKIRKEYSLFRLTNETEIKNKTRILKRNNSSIIFELSDENISFEIIIKNNFIKENFIMADNYFMIFDSYKIVENKETNFTVDKPGVFILKKIL